MSDWRPIESAPRDGTAFLCFMPRKGGYVADQRYQLVSYSGWGSGVWETLNGYGKYGLDEPTHWMPLPSEPDA